MKNMATIVQAFENDKQYEIELISTYIIPYFRLVDVYKRQGQVFSILHFLHPLHMSSSKFGTS